MHDILRKKKRIDPQQAVAYALDIARYMFEGYASMFWKFVAYEMKLNLDSCLSIAVTHCCLLGSFLISFGFTLFFSFSNTDSFGDLNRDRQFD